VEPMSKIFVHPESEIYSFGDTVSYIESVVRSNNSQVVAIDPLSLMKLVLSDNLMYRKSILALVSNLHRMGVTSFVTAEMKSSERSELKFSKEFFLFDGIVILYQSGQEDKRILTMEVVKMRGSNHSWALAPYEITPKGFRVFTIDQ
jgi:KaiC/GvpD/RAD55 family RecA-like ATPase